MTFVSGKASKGWLFGLGLAIGLSACAPAPCSPDRSLGSCCQDASDCPGELGCLEQFPGGLCSRDCAADHLCPDGGRCIHIVSQSRGDLGRACLALCGPELPACRPDYRCASTSEPGVKVCFPG